jgi:hypothetical protein
LVVEEIEDSTLYEVKKAKKQIYIALFPRLKLQIFERYFSYEMCCKLNIVPECLDFKKIVFVGEGYFYF